MICLQAVNNCHESQFARGILGRGFTISHGLIHSARNGGSERHLSGFARPQIEFVLLTSPASCVRALRAEPAPGERKAPETV